MSANDMVAGPNENAEVNVPDMFAHLPAMDPFEVKRDMIAADLAALIAHCGKTRSGIAEELGIHKSAVTRLLSGKNNTKINTIWEVVSHLGYDFDITYHHRDKTPSEALQPWHEVYEVQSLAQRHTFVIDLQTAEEVKRDFRSGLGKSVYLSIVEAVDRDVLLWDYSQMLDNTSPLEFNSIHSPDAYPISFFGPNSESLANSDDHQKKLYEHQK